MTRLQTRTPRCCFDTHYASKKMTAAEAYATMDTGKARYRMVLTV
jgi:hypothetical protein